MNKPPPRRTEKSPSTKRKPCIPTMLVILAILTTAALPSPALSAASHKAFRRDPGSPQWHHGAFHDVRDSIVRRMLHSRAEVPFQFPLEVNIVLVGFNGDGGFRDTLDPHTLQVFLKMSFSTHRPSCLETGDPLDMEHHLVYNVFPVGQPELVSLEKRLKEVMVPVGTARETEFGKEVPAFDVEATAVESVFDQLYNFIFDVDGGRYSESDIDRPVSTAIFVLNFDKVRMDPRNTDVNIDDFMYGRINRLTEDDMKKQEGDYIYRYRYNGGEASQVLLSSSRFAVIDLSAGPCTYWKIETEEGSISSKTFPRLRNYIFSKGLAAADHSNNELFLGQLGSLISTTVKKMVHQDQYVVIVGGVHALHHKATQGISVHETQSDGRFRIKTKTYIDGAILKEFGKTKMRIVSVNK